VNLSRTETSPRVGHARNSGFDPRGSRRDEVYGEIIHSRHARIMSRTNLRMREVGHADRSVNDRYTYPLEQAHLAAEQTAALVWKARKGSVIRANVSTLLPSDAGAAKS
jgi:hypothetical protein